MLGEAEEVRDSTNPDYRYTNVDNDVMSTPIEGFNNTKMIPGNTNSDTQNKNLKTLKIVFLGNKGSGITSIIKKFVTNKFIPEDKDVNNEIYNKKYQYENTGYNLELNDPCSIETMSKYPKRYFIDAYGAVIVYDITNRESYDSLEKWIKEVNENSAVDIIYYVLGNKADMTAERKVTKKEAEDFLKKQKVSIKYYEVSAKNGNNISLAFDTLIQDIVEKQNEEQNNPDKVERGETGRNTKHLISDEEQQQEQGQGKDKTEKKKKKCC